MYSYGHGYDRLVGANFFDEVNNIFKELEKSSFSSYQENFPPMDMVLDEATGNLELTFALAGFTKEEIDIQLDGDFLKISGKKAEKERPESHKVVRKGIRKRDFECKYQLPAKFNLGDAEASFEDGLLSLHIPVREESKPRKLLLK